LVKNTGPSGSERDERSGGWLREFQGGKVLQKYVKVEEPGSAPRATFSSLHYICVVRRMAKEKDD